MAPGSQTSLSEALSLDSPSYAKGSVQLPNAIGFGDVSSGGFVASLAVKIAILYAAGHPKLSSQTDARSVSGSFFRPVVLSRESVSFNTHEINVGKSWSTLRVEILQTKLCVETTILLTSFSIPGMSIDTRWTLSPPPTLPNSLVALEDGADPNWIMYHTAFHANGFRRAHSYIKHYLRLHWPEHISCIDQYLVPGWDCHPNGSRNLALPEARWTNELLPFAADSHLPVQENYLPRSSGTSLHLGSVAATLSFAAAQRRAKEAKVKDWRNVQGDGAVVFDAKFVHSTLGITLEMKKPLPAEGVRFLFVRATVKSIVAGRMNIEVLISDEHMDLVLVGLQVAQLVPASTKVERSGL